MFSIGPNECPVSCKCFGNVEFEFWYLKDLRCSLHPFKNVLPVCLMHFFLTIGTRESVNTTFAEFRDLAPVIYAKIFS